MTSADAEYVRYVDVQVIGAHQTESVNTRSTSILIDGRLALDAGGLAAALSIADQRRLEALLLTHYHFDHIRDLPTIALHHWDYQPLAVHCPDFVRSTLRTHIFNDLIWPNLERMPSPDAPCLEFHVLDAGSPVMVLDYRVTMVPVVHTVPAVGYRITSGGKTIFFTGDMRGRESSVWLENRVDLLLTEVTFPNRLDSVAEESCHLTADRLGRELDTYRAMHGQLPRVVALHVSSEFRDEVGDELRSLRSSLGADIVQAADGQHFVV